MDKKKRIVCFLSLFFCSFLEPKSKMLLAQQLPEEKGEKLFFTNCSVCHLGGMNIIIPEKNLKKETLEANGMNTLSAISYQIVNGKNGMPAFGGRLTEKEIEDVANYVLQQSFHNFQEEF
jgi:cytochrome c6